MITLTDKGAEKVREFLDTQETVAETAGLRVGVRGGGCSGSVIDFVDGLQGAGFKVENPNVIAACGCGSSFRVADEQEVSAV